jgi:hypothetical protein
MQELATSNGSLTTTNISIEDMASKGSAGSRVRFWFPRDSSSYELLNALLDFHHLGAKSWSFDKERSLRRRGFPPPTASAWRRRPRLDFREPTRHTCLRPACWRHRASTSPELHGCASTASRS